MQHLGRTFRPSAMTVAVTLGAIAPAHAQTAERALPEVTVRDSAAAAPTVRDAWVGPLGDRSLVDTPFSITPFTREFIDNRQANTVTDVVRADPSVNVVTPAGSFVGQYTIRGFIVFPDNLLYDGLVVGPGLSGANYPITNFERVEILKGPSAFLYGLSGFGSVGGAVNLVPKRAGQRIARLALGYASETVFAASADIGGRIYEAAPLALRLNAGYEGGESIVGTTGLNNKSLGLAVEWQPVGGLNIPLGYDYLSNRAARYQNGFLPLPGVPVPAPPDPKLNLMQPWTYFEQSLRQGYVRADWAFAENWSFTGQYLRGDSPRPYLSPGTGQVLNAAGDTMLNIIAVQDAEYRQETGAATVRGLVRTGPLAHNLAFGAAYNWYDYTSGLQPVGMLRSNLYHPIYYPEPLIPSAPVGKLLENTARSYYASDIVEFSDRWSALVGLRHVMLDYKNFNPVTGATIIDQSQSKTVPVYSLMYKPTPASLLYATYSQGLERGGIAPLGTTNAGQQLPPIETAQVELGGKIDLSQGLSLTTAIFSIQKGLEYVDAATRTYVQDGEQVHRGWEVFVSGRVVPRLTLVGGFMILNPEAKSTGNPATEGKDPIGVPRRTLSLWGDYRVPALEGLFVNAGVYYNSRQYVDATNERSIGSWTRFDVGLRYETQVAGRKTSLLLGVENLFDRNYWQGVNSGILALAAPRTVRATARIDF